METRDELVQLGMVPELAKKVVQLIDDGVGEISSDNVTVPAITADNFSFAGGTLTEALQAIADAIPAQA